MIIIDPLADMLRTMLNVAINCMIPTLAGGRAAMPDDRSVAIVGTADRFEKRLQTPKHLLWQPRCPDGERARRNLQVEGIAVDWNLPQTDASNSMLLLIRQRHLPWNSRRSAIVPDACG